MAQNEDDELVQEQRVLELQFPALERVPSDVSMASSAPMSDSDFNSQTSSPPRQRRRVQQQPERPIRGVGTPVRSTGFGSYSPGSISRLGNATAAIYDYGNSLPAGTIERALADSTREAHDREDTTSVSSGSQSVDLFGANEIRGRRRDPEPLPLVRFSETREGNALFRRRSRENLSEIPEMGDELRSPAPPGGLFADTLSTPDRKKNGGIKSKLRKSNSKLNKRTRKTKRRTRKSKRRHIKKKRTAKKKSKSRRRK